MPIPMYIICSQGATTDRDTGVYSIFEVIDNLILTEIPKPMAGEGVLLIERQRFVITSTWMIDQRNGETFDDEFEFNLSVSMETGEKVMEEKQTFKFQGPDKFIHRFTVSMIGPMPIKNSGILVVEGRVKKIGSVSSKSHTYKVVVQKQKLEVEKPEAPPKRR